MCTVNPCKILNITIEFRKISEIILCAMIKLKVKIGRIKKIVKNKTGSNIPSIPIHS